MAKDDNIGKMNPQQGPSAGSQLNPGGSHAGSPSMSGMSEQARDTLGNIKEKGQEALEGARESVATLPHRATEAVASQLKQAAEQLREHAPQQGTIGSAAHTVADGLESGATYLKEHDFRDMAEDLSGVVRSYPIPAVLAGIGIGFLLGRTLRS
jgi:hypothetical protein